MNQNPCEEMRLFFIDNFKKKGEEYLKFICGSLVATTVFMSKYRKFPPIENLDQEEKTNLKKYVHELFPGKTIEFKLRAAKIIYTINNSI